jgi:3-deoxy-D-arabino-heptulosonate 7-phosphate (DAHP) synthase class II
LCEACALSEGVIRVRDDLAVEAKRDRLLVQRGDVEAEVFAGEIRHLVAALVDAAAELAEVLALGGKAAWPTPGLDMPKRKERNDGRRGAYQAVSSR